MQVHLNNHNINLPDYWDHNKCVDAILKKSPEDLQEYFECGNASALTRKLNPYFPDRPKNMSFTKYLSTIVAAKPKPVWKPGQKQEDNY